MTATLLAHDAVRTHIDLLAAWIESQLAYKDQPGLSIGIVYDQSLVWAQGFGYANVKSRIEATPATIYRIASITKLFTSTALLQLRDEGKLQLDDPITKYLPWFAIQNRHPDGPLITIRHLITHTSGLPREAGFPYWSDANFPSREQVIAQLPQQETITPAETRLKYSNLALTLAGEIVAQISGQSYPDYVQTHILQPLEMTNTFVETIDSNHPQLAVGYGRHLPAAEREISAFTDCQGITPAANMATTVEDLAKFAMLQFRSGPRQGCQILCGNTLREMQRVHWLHADWKSGWGLGFAVNRQRGKTYIGHGGAVPGFRTQIKLCPEQKVAVIVLTNADDGNPLQYVDQAFKWVAPVLVEANRPQKPPAEADPAWQRYLGKYRSIWGDTQVLIVNGELVTIDPSLPDPMLTMVRLKPVSEHTFQISTTAVTGSNGELVSFEVDAGGQVTAMVAGSGHNRSERIESWHANGAAP